MSRSLKAFGILVLAGGLLAACSGGDDNGVPAADPGRNSPTQETVATLPPDAEPALPLNEAGIQLVARVNGAEITLLEFERAFERSQNVSDAASYDAAVTVVLNTLIEQVLINQQAAAMDIVVTEAEVEAQFQEMRAMLPDATSWQQWLADNSLTEEEFRQSLRDSLLTQRVQTAVVNTENLVVTTIHARHILVNTREDADAILARLQAGEDFAQLAAAYSQDPNTRTVGGDLGWFVRDDLSVPELADYAVQLQPGQYGGPFQTALGFHVVENLDTGQRPATPEEKATAGITRFATWLEAVRASADIERYIH